MIGELLITLGVLLFAFLLWQLWWTDVVGNRAQAEIVAELPFEPVPTATPSAGAPAGPVIAPPRRDEPPVMAEPPHATTFATIQVPRWVGEPERPISQGTDRATVLDVLGAGHYEGTAMPGGLGNFAVAGHRTTYAKPFNRVEELQVGDPLIIRTTDNIWYVYRVTSTEIVDPSNVGVIAPVPGRPRRGAHGAPHHADHVPPDVLRAGAVHRARRPGLLGAHVGRDPGRAGRWRMMVTCARDGGR